LQGGPPNPPYCISLRQLVKFFSRSYSSAFYPRSLKEKEEVEKVKEVFNLGEKPPKPPLAFFKFFNLASHVIALFRSHVSFLPHQPTARN
jgi:hypothetical protein